MKPSRGEDVGEGEGEGGWGGGARFRGIPQLCAVIAWTLHHGIVFWLLAMSCSTVVDVILVLPVMIADMNDN